ncbi:MAG: hypothetical protein AAFP18_13140 [Bacteroidota bacterium]
MRTLSLLLALLVAAPAFAQPAPADRAVTDRLGTQLATLLVNPVQRSAALDLTLVVAEQRPDIDLRPTVNALLDIYEADADVRHRRAAAVALAAIGDLTSMEQLADRARFEEDAAVRRTTVQLLGAYAASLSTRQAESLDFYIAD